MGDDATAISFVSNATAPALVALCRGDYGARPTRPAHALLSVNPSWTASGDVGNPWEGRLRKEAASVLEGAGWTDVYVCVPLRRPRSDETAVLLRVWPGAWRLLAADGTQLGAWGERPGDGVLLGALRSKA